MSNSQLHNNFREEATDHLDAVDKLILLYEKSSSSDLLNKIMRHCHSLKGLSKVVGASQLEKLTHLLEDVFTEIQSGKIFSDSNILDQLLATIDDLRSELTAFLSDRVQVNNKAFDRLRNLLHDCGFDLDSQLPQLDRNILKVLSDTQQSLLLRRINENKVIGELLFSSPANKFITALRKTYDHLKSELDIIAMVNLGCQNDIESFKFLVSAHEEELIENAAKTHNLTYCRYTSVDDEAERKAVKNSELFAEKLKELRDQFLQEKPEELDELERLIVSLDSWYSNNSVDKKECKRNVEDILNELFRRIHGIKGAGGTYKLNTMSLVAHQMENVLEVLKTHNDQLNVDEKYITFLLSGVDGLRAIVEKAKEGDIPSEFEEKILSSMSLSSDRNNSDEVPHLKTKSFQDTSVRVPLHRIDRFINLASELSLAQTTREESLMELEQLVDIQSQMRKSWKSYSFFVSNTEVIKDTENFEKLQLLENQCNNYLHLLQKKLLNAHKYFDSTTFQSARATESLLNDVVQMRLVPVSRLFDVLPRTVRDLSKNLGKPIELELDDGNAELDKSVLEQLGDPLIHLVRNAIDHGIESKVVRIKLGKRESGKLKIMAQQRGNQVVFIIKDDGAGINKESIIERALSLGLIDETKSSRLNDDMIYSLLFCAGFSTKKDVNEISGRGVGMDVVKQKIEELGGRVQVESELGKGTLFELHVPLTLSLIPVITLMVSNQYFGIQTDTVEEVVLVREENISSENELPCIRRGNKTVPIVWLSQILNLNQKKTSRFPVLILRSLEGVVGIVVDEVKSERQLMLKSLSGILKFSDLFAGASIQSDGSILSVFDSSKLVNQCISRTSDSPFTKSSTEKKKLTTILVADDSITTRELYKNMLSTSGFIVNTAQDGAQALSMLRKGNYDLLISDVQMPNLDGIQLTEQLRFDKHLKHTPVILISALGKDEEKKRGLECGADAYIVKGLFDQTKLLERIKELTFSEIIK